eukprot:485317-Pyramimonas_sp.AAC.1
MRQKLLIRHRPGMATTPVRGLTRHGNAAEMRESGPQLPAVAHREREGPQPAEKCIVGEAL